MLTAVNQLAEYEQGKPFSWFPEEVKSPRRETDKDALKKQLGDIAKLKGNSFFGKMIEDLCRHKSAKFTRDQWVVDKVLELRFLTIWKRLVVPLRSRSFKQTVMTKRLCQCGIITFQLAKLQILENFMDKYLIREHFELLYMDTDLFYFGESFDEIVKPELRQACEVGNKNWLATGKFSKKNPGLFNPKLVQLVGTRCLWLTANDSAWFYSF